MCQGSRDDDCAAAERVSQDMQVDSMHILVVVRMGMSVLMLMLMPILVGVIM